MIDERSHQKSKKEKQNRFRLSVFKTNRHLYAVLTPLIGNYTMTEASTLKVGKYCGRMLSRSKVGALIIGKMVALRAISIGVESIVFNRSRSKYHGLVEIVATSARNYGLSF